MSPNVILQGITLKNEQFKSAERKRHWREMTSRTVYSVAKLLFIQRVHTEHPLKNIHGRRMRQRRFVVKGEKKMERMASGKKNKTGR